jgi:hypothetical protein
MVMAWALASIVLLAVALPIFAWQFTRRRPAPPVGRLGTGYDKIDKWLIERYQLPPADRDRVRNAVSYGHQVRDPALALATCELAAEVLRGRLGLRAWRVLGWANIIAGMAVAVWGIVGLIVGHQVDGLPSLIPVGALLAAVGVAFAFWRPRELRRKAAQALALNKDAAAEL